MLTETRISDSETLREKLIFQVDKILPALTEHELPQSNLRVRFGTGQRDSGRTFRRVIVEAFDTEHPTGSKSYEPKVVADVVDYPGPSVSHRDIQVHTKWESLHSSQQPNCEVLGELSCNFSSRFMSEESPRNSASEFLLALDEISDDFPDLKLPKSMKLILSIHAFSLLSSMGLVRENSLSNT